MSARPTLACLLAAAALGAGLLAPPAARAAGPPLVEATWVEGVNATGATLWAEIDPNGLLTSYRFEYVTDAAFGQSGFATAALLPASSTPRIGSGTAAVKVSQHASGLSPATTYRYRVWATNSAETLFGPQRSLTTQDPTNLFSLPDNRGWELVSPIDKGGGAIQGPERTSAATWTRQTPRATPSPIAPPPPSPTPPAPRRQANTSPPAPPPAGRAKTSPLRFARAPTAKSPTASPTGSSPPTWARGSCLAAAAVRRGIRMRRGQPSSSRLRRRAWLWQLLPARQRRWWFHGAARARRRQ